MAPPSAGLAPVAPSGLPPVDSLPWGSHVCQFYRTRQDLVDTLVPYFAAGLRNGERCLWVTSAPLTAAEAWQALGRAIPDLDRRAREGQIQIVDHRAWYQAGGSADLDELVDRWLRSEREALEAGYAGLRISGNTSWLGRGDLAGFARYEARAHAAFQDRRVLALCSYGLDRCGPDEMLDVLRTHACALVRRDGRWEVARSATALLAAVEEEPAEGAPQGHAVTFYPPGRYPVKRIAGFLAEGLSRGECVVVIASAGHLAEIRRALADLGADVGAAARQERLVEYDADETLDRLTADGALDRERFEEVSGAVEQLQGRWGGLRVYGEIVDLLCRRGHLAGAIQLERWWNRLLRRRPFPVLCGYQIASFEGGAGTGADLARVCREHGQVETERGGSTADRDHLLSELQHKTRMLVQARARAEAATEHLALLQRVTASLSEAASATQIAGVVLEEMLDVVGAEDGAVALPAEDGAALRLLSRLGARRESCELPPDAGLPVADALRGGVPVWLEGPAAILDAYPALAPPRPAAIAALPFVVGGRRLGAVQFGFSSPQPFAAPQRALLHDLASQAAFALDRARLYEEAQRTRDRLQLLADASARVSGARLDLSQVLEAVAAEVIRGFAHGCGVGLRAEDGPVLRLPALRHLDAGREAEIRALLASVPLRADTGVIGRVFATGQAAVVSPLAEEELELAPEYRALLRRHAVRSLLFVPLRASGDVIGVLCASRDRRLPPFGREDVELLHELAARVGLSVENALLYERAQHERRRAEEANRAKDEFLAMLGHELRNPLSPIVTALQLMRLRGGEHLVQERALIERQAQHMIRLVDDLLDVSRVTRGKIELRRAPMELAEVVADAIEIASPMLEARSHALDASVPTRGLLVDADRHRLAQAISNLLTNAAKYTPPGGSIRLRADAAGRQVRLSVRDDGIGIEPDLLPRLFDLFVQGRRGLDRSEGGLGLGLTIVRTLVELHGGRVRAASDGPGTGSEFVIELPLLASEAAAPPAPTRELPAVGRTGAPVRILVVDDNRDGAEAIADALRMAGHDARTAYDGPSALALIADFRPTIALLDIGLPVMDGYELARRLSAALAPAPPRLVAVTGYGLDSDRARSASAGFNAHLVKPVDLDQLEALVRELS